MNSAACCTTNGPRRETNDQALFDERAAEIIAAYGADPARWPDGERATALAVIASSADLRAAQAAARGLDADLQRWAQAPVPAGDVAAAARQVLRRPRPLLRWALGTGLAASLAAGLVALAPAGHHGKVAPAAAVRSSDDATAFAQLFTPTPDEEQSDDAPCARLGPGRLPFPPPPR